jgi:very-short-patch-repair endonuclease
VAGSRPGGEIPCAVTYPAMGRVSHTARVAKKIAGLAWRQHGVVSRRQMLRLGLSEDVIDSWARNGRILRVQRGVYSLGHVNLDARGRIHAAVLACGPGAVASHRSAAYLLRIGQRAPLVVDVIPPGQRGRAIDGVRFHAAPYPARDEVVLVDGIPCTNVARTIIDLAGTYGEKELAETVERAATERLLDVAAIDAVLVGGPKRRGAPCLRRVLAPWRPVAETAKHATFRSLFEAKLLPLVAAADLPLPRFNAPIPTAERTLEVDLLWEPERLILEADSRKHHGIEVAFERDHRRTRELIAAHYRVLPVTWREVEQEPTAVLAVIRQELAWHRAPVRTLPVP